MKKYILVVLLLSIYVNLFSYGEKGNEKLANKERTVFTEDEEFTEIVIEMNNWDFSIEKIELMKGKNYRLTFITKKGRHGIKIPKLGYKSPSLKLNESDSFDLHAEQEGEFKFFCYIPCGKGHKDMVGKIIIK